MDGIDGLVAEFLPTIPLLEGEERVIDPKEIVTIFAPYAGRVVDPRELEPLERGKVARAFDELGILKYRGGVFQEARKYMRAARELDPRRQDYTHDLAMAEFNWGNFELAKQLFEKVVGPNSWGERDTHNLGLTFMRLGSFSKALPYLDAAVRTLDHPHSYAARSLVHLKQENQAGAAADIREALLRDDQAYRNLHKRISSLGVSSYRAA